MLKLTTFSPAKMGLRPRAERVCSLGIPQLFVKIDVHGSLSQRFQKTKVERYASTVPRHFTSRRCCSTERNNEKLLSSLHGRIFSDGRIFSNTPSSIAKRFYNRCFWSEYLFRLSNYRSPFTSSRRQKSSTSSTNRVQSHVLTSSPSNWKRRKNFRRDYILAAVMLLGGIIHALYKFWPRSYQSLCQAEGDVDGTEFESGVDKKSGLKLKESAESLKSLTLQEAIAQASDLCQRVKDESGSPGLVVAVSVDGQPVWTQGLGYADVENRLPCKPETVIRIASISKSITMTAVAKAMENGDLDLDKPVQFYVPKFPEKTVNGEKVTVTTRQLVSHMSGIRHYYKDYMNNNSKDITLPGFPGSKKVAPSEKKATGTTKSEFEMDEYYIKEKHDTTEAALALFQDDPLVHKPGTKYLYSTHAWSLVAAVLEGATKKKYPVLIRRLFCDLGLDYTYLDDNEPLIYNRARYYIRDKKGLLVNAPYVDCTYKYAGGGMLSTMPDLIKFGNAVLYSYQYQDTAAATNLAQVQESKTISVPATNKLRQPSKASHSRSPHPGYLKSSTVQQLWSPVKCTKGIEGEDSFYGMGWVVWGDNKATGFGEKNRFYVWHTGAAIGASSILLILLAPGDGEEGERNSPPPRGVCVAMGVNMVKVSLRKTAFQIARLFERVSRD